MKSKPKLSHKSSANGGSARKLAAIMIADAVGYSRLVGSNEAAALAAFRQRRAVIEAETARHRGRVFGGAGDSVVAEFSSAVDALAAVVAFQTEIERLNESLPEDRRMPFRAGINLGDVVVEKGNLFGEGVNIAERLQALATSGGICISASVHEQLLGRADVRFADLGEVELKNIGHKVHAYRVLRPGEAAMNAAPARAIAGRAAGWRIAMAAVVLATVLAAVLWLANRGGEPPTVASGPPVIAVLPFANLSGDPRQDYFSEGVSQDIVSALGRFAGLTVLSTNASRQISADKAGPAAAARGLGVRYLVTGSVRRAGGDLRVSVDLADTERQHQLWAQQYDRRLTDIFAVQDEIAGNIVGMLAVKVGQIEKQRSIGKPTDNLDAYDLLLRGWAQMVDKTLPEILAARELFEKALKLDANYADAQAALGVTYFLEATGGFTEFAGDALMRAEALAKSALAIQPEQPDAHQLLGLVSLARKDYDRARSQVEHALGLNPSDADSHAAYGNVLVFTGDAQASISAFETAFKLDPTLDWTNLPLLGFAHYIAGDYEKAVASFEPNAGRGGDWSGYAGVLPRPTPSSAAWRMPLVPLQR